MWVPYFSHMCFVYMCVCTFPWYHVWWTHTSMCTCRWGQEGTPCLPQQIFIFPSESSFHRNLGVTSCTRLAGQWFTWLNVQFEFHEHTIILRFFYGQSADNTWSLCLHRMHDICYLSYPSYSLIYEKIIKIKNTPCGLTLLPKARCMNGQGHRNRTWWGIAERSFWNNRIKI